MACVFGFKISLDQQTYVIVSLSHSLVTADSQNKCPGDIVFWYSILSRNRQCVRCFPECAIDRESIKAVQTGFDTGVTPPCATEGPGIQHRPRMLGEVTMVVQHNAVGIETIVFEYKEKGISLPLLLKGARKVKLPRRKPTREAKCQPFLHVLGRSSCQATVTIALCPH